ncbi:MAG: BsuBI/PstI family type II restriction endonuclease [Lachnospiraceae bacterium]
MWTVFYKYGNCKIYGKFIIKTYKKFSEALAWETEVWIAEMPEHMIHLNGDKFLGPR